MIRIPSSLAELPKLPEVSLVDNGIEGGIPGFKANDLRLLNLSYNLLDGHIPLSLGHFNSTSSLGKQYRVYEQRSLVIRGLMCSYAGQNPIKARFPKFNRPFQAFL
ncbi:hypothetical protein Nepgr_013650 [Nepenthes gracilis]|uniref:Uncharacterized protein n=1 Tax=Nepenthes gracilis TaxID=150966 RepID=A0AAD3SJG2_NEPGR|nr:hypothetical protein Nepgr_013650 [Nepenthes gracilis]